MHRATVKQIPYGRQVAETVLAEKKSLPEQRHLFGLVVKKGPQLIDGGQV